MQNKSLNWLEAFRGKSSWIQKNLQFLLIAKVALSAVTNSFTYAASTADKLAMKCCSLKACNDWFHNLIAADWLNSSHPGHFAIELVIRLSSNSSCCSVFDFVEPEHEVPHRCRLFCVRRRPGTRVSDLWQDLRCSQGWDKTAREDIVQRRSLRRHVVWGWTIPATRTARAGLLGQPLQLELRSKIVCDYSWWSRLCCESNFQRQRHGFSRPSRRESDFRIDELHLRLESR